MRNNAKKTRRGRPFPPGNSGRPVGSRNKATLMAEAILESEVERLSRRLVERALEGDSQALKLCIDRLLPPRRERPVTFSLPPISNAAAAATATSEIISAASHGELSLAETEALVRVLEAYSKVLFAHEFEQRLSRLEEEKRNEDGNATPSAAGGKA